MDGANVPAHCRETRISFELHPQILLMELIKDESWWPRDETRTNLNIITDDAY